MQAAKAHLSLATSTITRQGWTHSNYSSTQGWVLSKGGLQGRGAPASSGKSQRSRAAVGPPQPCVTAPCQACHPRAHSALLRTLRLQAAPPSSLDGYPVITWFWASGMVRTTLCRTPSPWAPSPALWHPTRCRTCARPLVAWCSPTPMPWQIWRACCSVSPACSSTYNALEQHTVPSVRLHQHVVKRATAEVGCRGQQQQQELALVAALALVQQTGMGVYQGLQQQAQPCSQSQPLQWRRCASYVRASLLF